MRTAMHSLTWWPWTLRTEPIRAVRRVHEGPGLVTLCWDTEDEVPTVVTRGGRELYRDDAPRQAHRITLVGEPGSASDLRIHAGEATHGVEVVFQLETDV